MNALLITFFLLSFFYISLIFDSTLHLGCPFLVNKTSWVILFDVPFAFKFSFRYSSATQVIIVLKLSCISLLCQAQDRNNTIINDHQREVVSHSDLVVIPLLLVKTCDVLVVSPHYVTHPLHHPDPHYAAACQMTEHHPHDTGTT